MSVGRLDGPFHETVVKNVKDTWQWLLRLLFPVKQPSPAEVRK